MRISPKPLLVVSQNATNINISAKKNAICIVERNRIFPSIHELQPDGIILDHDYLGTDAEKILRRITSNPFYSKIKIYCYKSRPHTKVDGLLAALGVQQFIYAETIQQPKGTITGKLLNYVMETVVATTLADAG
ncbi:hypothetical protein [Mucilaginibacter sp. UR6-11]|uniref:hypothetical protein n=1 Tax=Mucilaginibacter sp. UR6-11 TaxID=1435644 RepID=UPI001E49E2EA|nr:hypothetical protein [Mucilaginibacter sp. UR6-11]MCC8426564.1 hypothetical protein [Mucilaginibacter sp. UR6-11]